LIQGLKLVLNEFESKIVVMMKSAKKSILEGGITRIELPSPIDTDNTFSNVLYERPFYNELLKSIRSKKRILLIGNPGIAKSYFQYYYLVRILNPSLFGQLPPDHLGSTEPPKFIVRQVGEAMYLYSLEDSKVFYSPKFSSLILHRLPASHTLYWYEPAVTKNIPVTRSQDIPTLATVSADIRRYEEYQKIPGVLKLYMPVWTLEELLSVGKDFRLRMKGTLLYDFFSPDKISDRFKKYGGIFRFVLPTSIEYLVEVDNNRKDALANADVRKLLLSTDIQMQHASSYVLHYNVIREGENAFKYKSMQFASEEVERHVRSKEASIPLSEAIEKMIAIDTGYMEEKKYLASFFFEQIFLQVSKSLISFFLCVSKSTSFNISYSLSRLVKWGFP
jgi:hypothetical protein